MTSEATKKVIDKFGVCNSKHEDEGDFTHTCYRRKNHEGKHKCFYCNEEWENESTNSTNR